MQAKETRGWSLSAMPSDQLSQLATIQHDLFNLGADLATRKGDRWEGMRLIEHEHIPPACAQPASVEPLSLFLPLEVCVPAQAANAEVWSTCTR